MNVPAGMGQACQHEHSAGPIRQEGVAGGASGGLNAPASRLEGAAGGAICGATAAVSTQDGAGGLWAGDTGQCLPSAHSAVDSDRIAAMGS